MSNTNTTLLHNSRYRLSKLYDYNGDTSKTWLIEFYQFNIKTGQKERRFFSKFNTSKDLKTRRREAQKWINFIDQQLKAGAVYNPDSRIESKPKPATKPALFVDDIRAYLKRQSATLRPNSLKTYRAFADKWDHFAKGANLEKLHTVELTPAHCLQFVDYLIALPICNTTRNGTIIRLKAVCNHYAEPGRERFAVSPAKHLKMFQECPETHKAYTEDQARKVLAEIDNRGQHDLLLFVYMVHYTFGRPGREVRLLKVRDVLPQTVLYVATNTKSKKSKSPTIPPKLEELITRLGIRSYSPDFYVFGSEGKPGPIVRGKNYFYNRHADVLKKLNFPEGYTLYSWKHTGNIRALLAGVNLRSLQNQNGHTSLKTTEIYLRSFGTFVDYEIINKFNW
jgi:integrase